MGLRETINRNPLVMIGFALLAVVVVVFVIYRQIKDLAPSNGETLFFTIDDGKTWFPADKSNIPPFPKTGALAVRAHVYRCKGGGEPFVGYMERYTESARKQLVDYLTEVKESPKEAIKKMGQIQGIMQDGVEYKKPGAKEWSRQNVAVMCPSGRSEDLEPVIEDR